MSVSSQGVDSSNANFNSGAAKVSGGSVMNDLTLSQKVLLDGFLTLNNPKDIPNQEIRYAYPTTGNQTYISTYGGTNGQRVLKFNLPKEENLNIIGPHIKVELGGCQLSCTGGAVSVSGSGAALPNCIESIFDVYKVRVGSEYVHDINSNFGMLKRKLKDVNASMEWANGIGAVQNNYVLDPDQTANGFAGWQKLAANSFTANGATPTYNINKRYQFGLLPNGFLDKYIPSGSLPTIEIELDLVSDPRSVVSYQGYTVTGPSATTITITNPRLIIPCYLNKEMHDINTATFTGYYDDFQSFAGMPVTASATTATHQFPLARKSVSGIIGTHRVSADITGTIQDGSDGTTYDNIDKQGVSSHIGLSQYFFRFNGIQLPRGEYIDATSAVETYELLRKFAHEYEDRLSDENFYKYSPTAYSGEFIGGTAIAVGSSQINPYAGTLSNGQVGFGGTMCRFNLFHSFRADSALLYGIKTDQNTNTLELVYKSIAAPAVAIQSDYWVRYDVFYYREPSGNIKLVA